MKPKKDWLRKASKRKLKGKDRGIVDFMRICYHFFQELPVWISEMADPRNTSYTTYTQTDHIYMGILKNICSVESMSQMEEKFNENHYLLTQTADILMQLYLAWNPLLKTAGQTIKNTSQALLESFRRQTVTPEDVAYITTHLGGVSGMIIQQVGEKWNRENEKLSTAGCRAGKMHKKDVNEIPENARPCG